MANRPILYSAGTRQQARSPNARWSGGLDSGRYEEAMLRLTRTIHDELGRSFCVPRRCCLIVWPQVLREGPYRDIWIQPAAGDAGGALGAALAVWHQYHEQPRLVRDRDEMAGSYLGPCYEDGEIRARLDAIGASYDHLEETDLLVRVADLLAQENIVGWVQGRMEFGPRALGSRSILGDPRSPRMQSVMNLKIKYRESFRPFAPAVLAESVSTTSIDRPSPTCRWSQR